MFNHKYRYLFVITLGIYSYLSSLFLETFRYYDIQVSHFLLVSAFVLVCLLVWEGNRLIQSLIVSRIVKQNDHFQSLVISFFISQLIAVAAGVVVYFLIGIIFLAKNFSAKQIELKLVILYALRVNLFLQCLHGIFFFFERFRKKQLEAESLKRINIQARLQAITGQINPHFLFNNLNVLSTLVLQKNSDANKFIEAFSAVYRYILQNRDSEIVPLSSELEFIEPYIFLLKTRFSNALDIQVSINEESRGRYIVPVALQLLIENATKHNVVSAKLPLHVKLFVNEDNYLVVENNYQQKKEQPVSNNIGLSNINQRYKILTGREIIVKKDEHFFSVAIPLLQPGELKTSNTD